MSDAYASMYENRFAAHAGKDTDPGANVAKPSKDGNKKGVYTMKGKDGKPLFDKKEETEVNGDQLDEVAPLVAGLAGKAAGALAGKAATAGAAKAGGGLAKAASSKLGKAAINAGSNAVGNKVERKMSEESEESYTTSYMEAYKKLPANKMQDKAATKPDTAKGESQARKMDTVRKATKAFPGEVKDAVKGQQLDNNKKGLEKKFAAPSADKGSKNKAYKLENQRRQDLNKRYGPKKEEAEAVLELLIDEGVALNSDAAYDILNHMSEEWFDSIAERMEPKEDKDKAKKKADAQYKADRKAAAKERAERRDAGEGDNPLQAG